MSAGTGIDERAVVDPQARLGNDVFVGPFCIVGPQVSLGDGCRLHSHVSIVGDTEIGSQNEFWPFASVGAAPQDLKFEGEPTRLVIGARNRIRECVTINLGTKGGGGLTRLGDDNLLMAYAHIAHDCHVGNSNIFANAATLAGHVEVGDSATIGAFSAVHQFCRVADQAFIGGFSVVTRDALPWVTTVGNRAEGKGLNVVGLKRKGYSAETIQALKKCYTTLFQSKMILAEAVEKVEAELGHVEEVRYFLEFVRGSERGVCR
jgi:UDP-N-acetylglucosamine acyltransferase